MTALDLPVQADQSRVGQSRKPENRAGRGDQNMFVETSAIDAPRIHYEHLVYSTLRVAWRHRRLVIAVLGVALATLLAALTFMAPKYTGEAIIQLDFVRSENVAGEKLQSTAAVDAAAIVDGSARIIRSRGTASAVVSALRLDNDPDYTQLSRAGRALSHISSFFGRPAPTPRDVAVTRLMKQITVTNDPRSYLITVAVTASNPERAASLANWVASEYLRGRLRAQATEAYAAAERELARLSAVFGPRHPTYLDALAKLDHLKETLESAGKDVATEQHDAAVARDMVRFAAGQSLLPAEAVMAPSGPNSLLLFVLTILAALAVGVLLSLLAERGRLQRFGSMSATRRRRR